MKGKGVSPLKRWKNSMLFSFCWTLCGKMAGPLVAHFLTSSFFSGQKMFHICLTVNHTSKSESLSVTERMVPPSPRSFILETLVVGLAAAHGDSAELCGVHPDSDMERRPLWPSPWCWSLKNKNILISILFLHYNNKMVIPKSHIVSMLNAAQSLHS